MTWLSRLILLFGIGILLYSLVIIVVVSNVPFLDLNATFECVLFHKADDESEDPDLRPPPAAGARLVALGSEPVSLYSQLINASPKLLQQIDLARQQGEPLPPWAKASTTEPGAFRIRARLVDLDTGQENYAAWVRLGGVPWRELLPSVLWFMVKVGLFVLAAILFWNRPNDAGASQFFLLSTVTLGAFMGGFHWTRLASQPGLIVLFIFCGCLLPLVSLHFYLHFPRRLIWLDRWPAWFWAVVYGLPWSFLVSILVLYIRQRFYLTSLDAEQAERGLRLLWGVTFTYVVVAAIYFLAAVACLLHSYRVADDPVQKKQVRCLFYGAFLATLPIGYTLVIAIFRQDLFAAGGAAWPMFFASFFLTAAYAISITQYRLMEIDKLVNSGVAYFLFTLFFGILYYGVVVTSTLIFNQYLGGPSFSDAVTTAVTALLGMVMLDLARTPMQKVLDRRFSRSRAQLQQTLTRMGEAVAQLVDGPAVANRLLNSVTDFLGVGDGAAYWRDPQTNRLVRVGVHGTASWPDDLATDHPLAVASSDGRSIARPVWGAPGLSPAHEAMEAFQADFAQPLVQGGDVTALLLLGSKGTPYRPEDVNLLAAFAQIGVLALEGVAGYRTIEHLNRELQQKIDQISEQQQRIVSLQSQLRSQTFFSAARKPADAEAPAVSPAPAIAETPLGRIIGSSDAVKTLAGLVRKVAATDAVVLIRGESGAGKELVAQAIHESSSRAAKPFIKVHCAALSSNLLESELFGHVKGAFTGAVKDKVGRFELANGGTLFLDEIGDVSLEVQTKLLRVLQERSFERVGSSESVSVDVRIVTATHQDLTALIRQGRFREDLFYRLNVFPIFTPSLRERRTDIPELSLHFIRQFSAKTKKEIEGIDGEALDALQAYSWPGNVRQLENAIERAVVITEGRSIGLSELPPEIQSAGMAYSFAPISASPPRQKAPASLSNASLRQREATAVGASRWHEEQDVAEREQLLRALTGANGNKSEAARMLGMARSTFVSKLRKHGML